MLRGNPFHFVKKSTEIPKVVVHAPSACPLALRLADRGLIGNFTGLWTSPKDMHL
jgi:hypothetical protein